MPTIFIRLPDSATFDLGVPLITGACRLMRRMVRFRIMNRHIEEHFIRSKKPCLMALWHRPCLFQAIYYQGQNMTVIVSQSREGEIITRVLQNLGHTVLRGSSTRGGLEAMRDQLKRLREGRIAAVICDGPRGPVHLLKIGIILMARDSGAPILPIGFAARHCVKTKSWDSTLIPLPGSLAVINYGNPIDVPAGIRSEECFTYRQNVEEALNRATREAEDELRSAAIPASSPR